MNDVNRSSDSRPAPDDHGFTLIEVLTAIVVLGIVTTAAIAFAIQGTEATGSQERRQVAIAVATDAMETVNAHVSSTDSASGVSYLLTGREDSKVATVWNSFTGFPGVSDTYAGFDPTATNDSTPAIALQQPVTRNGTDYTVTTLIGWCFKQSASGDCTLIPTYPTDPPTTDVPGWANRMMRVTAIVQWSAGAACSSTPCSYQAITLIDASDDLEWVSG